MKLRVLALIPLFAASLAFAQEDVEITETGANAGKVLDFETEVIEGQRKAPQLFLQMDVGTPDLDAVMYLRGNFNDFHAVERNRKPLYRRQGK
ncbi:MAG: hypothetical protein KF767_10870 [Bdellovibrionaceae bacterium]|nr:hypothetical protein [Pseudobdellovibrionaceae bacterium]